MNDRYTKAELAFVMKHFMTTVTGKAESALKAVYNEGVTELKAADRYNVSLESLNRNSKKLSEIKTTLKLFKVGDNRNRSLTLEDKLKKLVTLLDEVVVDTRKLSYLSIDKVNTSEDVFAVAQAGGLRAILDSTSVAIEQSLDGSILLNKVRKASWAD